MAYALRPAEPAPIFEMNITPLIDVMLVLLVMFIITIPVQTHAVKLDLPAPYPSKLRPPNAIKNLVVITRSGAILWNGDAMSEADLRQEFRITQQMSPTPELHLQPDADARYEVVDRVLAMAKGEHVSKIGFIGNERFRSF